MYKSPVELFDKVLNIDFTHANAYKLEQKLERFKITWMQKDRDHTMMLSSHYTGVYKAVFSNLDMEAFFRIFSTNGKVLKTLIVKLNGMNKSWQVVTNPMYQLIVYLMHKYIKLGYKDLNRVLQLLYELITYPMLTSMLYQFFGRQQTIEEAKAAFEKLNYKFLLKKLGSWDSVIKYKAKTVMKDGRFWDSLNKLDTLKSIDIISGIQTSYKSLLVNIAGITHTGIAGKIDTNTTVVGTLDGGTDLRVVENSSNYINYVKSILPIEKDFIDMTLASIVCKRLKNVDYNLLIDTLKVISLDYNVPKKNDTFIEDIMVYSMEYLNSKNVTKYTDLSYIQTLKGFWSFGNSKTKPVKDLVKKYSYSATGKKTEWIINSLVIAVLIYIFTRAIIKK